MEETAEVGIGSVEQKVKTGVSLAEHFVSSHPEIKKAHENQEKKRGLGNLFSKDREGKASPEDAFALAQEAYDLFLERQDLRIAIRRQQNAQVARLRGQAVEKIESGDLQLVSEEDALAMGYQIKGEGEDEESEDKKTKKHLDKNQIKAATIARYLKEHESKPKGKLMPQEERLRLISEGRVDEVLLASSGMEEGEDNLLAESMERVEETQKRLAEILSSKQVYDRYQQGFEHEMGIARQVKEVRRLENLVEGRKVEELKLTRRAWVEGRRLTSVEKTFIQDNVQIGEQVTKRADELLADPEVFAAVRLDQLRTYQEQLREDHFVETPSRRELIERVGVLIAEGKKILLTGETGTGKTELWFHASRELFGTRGQYVTGSQNMTQYEIYGRTGLGKQEDGQRGDIFREGPLTRSYHSREGRGEPFLWDEFNNTKNEVIMGSKTHLNAGPGDTVSLQMDGEKDYLIGSDWAFGATSNIKSDRYQTRVELDPAIIRMFDESIRVSYIPPEEMYDILLSSLLDKRGGVGLSSQDAQETLAHFTDAIGWIQSAFQGKEIITDAGEALSARGGATTGRVATLEEAILDPGKAISMLAGYEQAKVKGVGLREYLNKQILRFIDNENYSEEDRYYLVEIFALKGFFGGMDGKEFGIPGLDDAILRAWNGGKEAEEKIDPEAYTPPEQVARLDPYGVLEGRLQEGVDDLLGARREQGLDKLEGVSSKYKKLVEAVGDIATDESSGEVHKTYVNKLFEKASYPNSNTVEEKKEAIRLLEDYAAKGNYNGNEVWSEGSVRAPNDTYISVREHARRRALDLRKGIIKESEDLGVIRDLAGDIYSSPDIDSDHQRADLDKVYIYKLQEIGKQVISHDKLKKIISLLEDYATKGNFNEGGVISPGSVRTKGGSYISLRERAGNIASDLRKKMMD